MTRQRPTKTITEAYTTTDADNGYRIICNSETPFTITLHSATGRYNFELEIDNIGAGAVTVGSQTVATGSHAHVGNSGAAWVVVIGGGAETDPVFTASAAYGIASGDISNWDDAHTHAGTAHANVNAVVPTGGTTGQVLKKTSATNYDLTWGDPATATNGIPSGGTTNQLLAKNSNTDYDGKWVDAPEAANGIPDGGSTGQVLAKVDGTDYNAAWATPSGGGDVKSARFVIGTSTAGWTSADCDYLCDGTADDVEINAAITALPATGGGIVILDGTYNITAKININKDNVSVKGNGNATILKRTWDSSSTEGVIVLVAGGCKIEDLQIDGNKSAYTAILNYCIYVVSSNNTIKGNTCNNNVRHGIYLSSADNNIITSNICNNNMSGIYLSSADNNTVVGNTCNNNTNNGICLIIANNNTITGNTCNNNNITGIYSLESNNNTVVGNTYIRGTGQITDYTSSQYTILLAATDNNYNLISNNNCMGKAVTVEGGTGNSVWGNKWDAGDYADYTTTEKTKLAGIEIDSDWGQL